MQLQLQPVKMEEKKHAAQQFPTNSIHIPLTSS